MLIMFFSSLKWVQLNGHTRGEMNLMKQIENDTKDDINETILEVRG